MRLLLADGDADLQQLLRTKLTEASYQVAAVATTMELLDRAASVRYDLIITERDFRDDDGLDAIRSLRSKGVSAPILIVTGRGSIEDRVRGLDSGADDYLIKPFSVVEFLARVRALLRRPYSVLGPVLRCGNLELDEATGEVRCSGRPLEVRPSERRLLALLMRRGGAVVSKSVIENGLSEVGRDVSANAIEALVSRARRAVDWGKTGIDIETVRGVGYRLIEKDQRQQRARKGRKTRPRVG